MRKADRKSGKGKPPTAPKARRKTSRIRLREVAQRPTRKNPLLKLIQLSALQKRKKLGLLKAL